MSSLPSCIVFCNGDISQIPPDPPPSPPEFIGAQPAVATSDAGFSEITNLQNQLFINDTMTKAEFDARVAGNPNYPTIVHLQGLRILVILPDFYDHVNRHLADVVIFLHLGLADVECNRLAWPRTGHPELSHTFPEPVHPEFPHEHHRGVALGPPSHSFDMQRLTIYELLRAAGHHNEVRLPFECMPHCGLCQYPFFCDRCHGFDGQKKCGKCGCDCKCGCDILIDNQGRKLSPIYLKNCDNESNNYAFIHRK